jgi:hypothetical protein
VRFANICGRLRWYFTELVAYARLRRAVQRTRARRGTSKEFYRRSLDCLVETVVQNRRLQGIERRGRGIDDGTVTQSIKDLTASSLRKHEIANCATIAVRLLVGAFGPQAVGQREIAIEVTRVKRTDRRQLMDDHLRPRARHSLRHLIGIKGIRHHRHSAQLVEQITTNSYGSTRPIRCALPSDVLGIRCRC